MVPIFVKYLSEQIQIGQDTNLYAAPYGKLLLAMESGHLEQVPNNPHPSEFFKSDNRYRFRFPFPLEDRFSLQELTKQSPGNYVAIKVSDPQFVSDDAFQRSSNGLFTLHLVQQQLIRRQNDGTKVLSAVFIDPSNKRCFAIDMKTHLQRIISDMETYGLAYERNGQKRALMKSIIDRVNAGYALEQPIDLKTSVKSRVISPYDIKLGRTI